MTCIAELDLLRSTRKFITTQMTQTRKAKAKVITPLVSENFPYGAENSLDDTLRAACACPVSSLQVSRMVIRTAEVRLRYALAVLGLLIRRVQQC